MSEIKYTPIQRWDLQISGRCRSTNTTGLPYGRTMDLLEYEIVDSTPPLTGPVSYWDRNGYDILCLWGLGRGTEDDLNEFNTRYQSVKTLERCRLNITFLDLDIHLHSQA